MSLLKRPHNCVLTILLVSYSAIALWYTFMLPPGEGMDEQLHLDYAYHIARTKRLPVQGQAIMVHHPPLYYMASVPLLLPFGAADRPMALQPNPHFVWDENGNYGWRVRRARL